MGEQDSYRETFALWVGNTQVSGSDHSGEFRMAGEANLTAIHYGEVDMQVCKHGCKKVNRIYITKKSVDWPGLIIRHIGYSRNANVNFLNPSQLERGRDVT